MSIKIMSQIWEHGPEDKTQLLLLLALSDYANDAGECWPSIASLCKKTRASERTVRRQLRALEEDGWLETGLAKGPNGTNRYTVRHPATGGNMTPGHYDPPCTDGPSPPVTVAPPPGHSYGPRTVIEPSLNRQSPPTPPRGKDEEAREILLSVLSEEAADAYIEHRRAKRAKLTPQAARLIARKLDGHPNPTAVVEESIANGWTGVFPDKVQVRRSSADHMQQMLARIEAEEEKRRVQ